MPRNFIECSHCYASAVYVSKSETRERYWCESCRAYTYIKIDIEATAGRNSFKCYNHQFKANRIIAACESRWTYEGGPHVSETVRFMLTDSDAAGRLNFLRSAYNLGIRKFFVYPHAARPSMINDQFEAWERTTAQFVVNEHHAEVLRTYGYKKPLESIGWFMCGIKPFESRFIGSDPLRVLNVLFAPIHPRNASPDKEANRKAFETLYPLAQAGAIRLTVRHIGPIADSGFHDPEKGIPVGMENLIYTQGSMDQDTQMIQEADVVIAHQTYAWLAVAQGVPCVMFGEDMPAHLTRKDNGYINYPSWGLVSHLFRFPLDLTDCADTMGLLYKAIRSDSQIADWKARMIGKPFNPENLINIIERYL